MPPRKLSESPKFRKVMKEYGSGTLIAGYGKPVTNPKQAVAIAYQEARAARLAKRKMKKKK